MDNGFDLKKILIMYFRAQRCTVIEENRDTFYVQLTKELDIEMMNRPFYWHYMETIGSVGEPQKLYFTTNPNLATKDVHLIHIGTPIVTQIFNHLEKTSTCTHLYEQLDTKAKTLLQPWLITNCLIIFKGIQLKEELLSIGLNLINGSILLNMMDLISHVDFSENISSYCFKISPLIKLDSAYKRVTKYLNEYVATVDLTWAIESERKLKDEIGLLEAFYKGVKDKSAMENEKINLYNLLQPVIKTNIINGGMFYISEETINYLHRKNPCQY